MRVKFTDGPDAVDIRTDQGLITVERGKVVDLPARHANALVRGGWQKVAAPPKKHPAKTADEPETKEGAKS